MQNPSKYIDKRIKVVSNNWDACDFHEFKNLINVYFNNKFVEKGIKLRVDHPTTRRCGQVHLVFQ